MNFMGGGVIGKKRFGRMKLFLFATRMEGKKTGGGGVAED